MPHTPLHYLFYIFTGAKSIGEFSHKFAKQQNDTRGSAQSWGSTFLTLLSNKSVWFDFSVALTRSVLNLCFLKYIQHYFSSCCCSYTRGWRLDSKSTRLVLLLEDQEWKMYFFFHRTREYRYRRLLYYSKWLIVTKYKMSYRQNKIEVLLLYGTTYLEGSF